VAATSLNISHQQKQRYYGSVKTVTGLSLVLNERDSRFDYFTYTGTFNTTLPEDLSVALGEVNGKLGTDAPTYYLTDYEML
jgi:hypothetical protein